MAESEHRFEDLWAEISPILLGLALRSTGNWHDAEDIVSVYAVYTYQHVSRQEWVDDKHVRGYFVMIFKKRLITEAKRRKRYRQVLDTVREQMRSSHEPDIGLVDGRIILRRDDISKSLRMFCEGYSYTDIGIALGLSKATICRKVNRDLQRIRVEMHVNDETVEG